MATHTPSRSSGIAPTIGMLSATPGTSSGSSSTPLAGRSAPPPAMDLSSILLPGEDALPKNPHEAGTRLHAMFEKYIIPLTESTTAEIKGMRHIIKHIAERYKNSESPLAKVVMRQQMIDMCISLVKTLFIRAQVFTAMSAGSIMLPSEIESLFLSSKDAGYQRTLQHFKEQVKLGSNVEKAISPKVSFRLGTKQTSPSRNKSILTRPSKTSFKAKDSDKSGSKKVASEASLLKTLESEAKGDIIGNPTMPLEIMDLVAGFEISDVLKEDLAGSVLEVTSETGVTIPASSSVAEGTSLTYHDVSKAVTRAVGAKSYSADIKGKTQQVEDTFAKAGVPVKAYSAKAIDRAMLIMSPTATRGLARSSQAVDSFLEGSSLYTMSTGKRRNLKRPHAAYPSDSSSKRKVTSSPGEPPVAASSSHLSGSSSGVPSRMHDLSSIIASASKSPTTGIKVSVG